MDIKDAFRVLGIKSSATADDANRARRLLVRINHPDQYAHDPPVQSKAQEQLKQINLAYEMVIQFLKSNRNQHLNQKYYRENGSEEAERRRKKQSTRQYTAERGIQATMKKLELLGAKDCECHRDGRKKFISFISRQGQNFKVTTRAKSSGDWQTSITYGEHCSQNDLKNEYWVFVDLELDPPKFYPVPSWWILNNIYEVHQEYLKKHGGHRRHVGNSSHHGVQLKRIKQWEDQWEYMDL